MAYCKKVTNKFSSVPIAIGIADHRRYQLTISENLPAVQVCVICWENEISVCLKDKILSQNRVNTTILNNFVLDNTSFQSGFKSETGFLKSFLRTDII